MIIAMLLSLFAGPALLTGYEPAFRWTAGLILGAALAGTAFSAGLLLVGWTGPQTSILLSMVAATSWIANHGRSTPKFFRRSDPRWLAIFCVAAGITVFLFFVEHSIRYPDGGWDARAIWNLRARELFRAPHNLALIFGPPELGANHPDYPLMLPGLIADAYFSIGGEHLFVPVAIAGLFSALGAALLYSEAGAAAVAVLLGTPMFVTATWSQYADAKVAILFLGALALVIRGELVLAGLCGGLGAYTKNEGLTLLAALLVASGIRSAPRILCGALPPLALELYFKIRWAPTNDLVANTPRIHDLLTRASIPTRWMDVIGAFVPQITDFHTWGLALPVLLALWLFLYPKRSRSDGARIARRFSVLGLIPIFAVFLVTPIDITAHATSALDRLLFQLWPSMLLATSLSLNLYSAAAAGALDG